MLYVVPKAGGRTIADLGPEHFGVTMEEDEDEDTEANYNKGGGARLDDLGGGGGRLSARSSRVAWVKDMIHNRVKRQKSTRCHEWIDG